MNNPRTRVRRIIQSVVEDCGEDYPEVIRQALDRVMEDEELTEYLVQDIVKKEVSTITSDRKPSSAPRDPSPLTEETILPAIKSKDQFLVDMASMTRYQLFPLAEKMEEESDKLGEQAAFVRAVASQLGEGEKVRDRFDRDSLLRIKGAVSITNQRRYFLNGNDITKTATRRELV